ncbi:MAG: protein phosphatase 2C domain-containing protein [Gammaproteobacteria bacterium]|jgi:serine/threonine protein phosphatase PrpC|uniref:PP2C family protein-serine/threonine phosphatase n=1 Tax=Nevskia sp. TaxID=1929292 RepID=UPI00403611F6|nr:protein phosphatase 2C domain-containing protein [Gammaproteobacteria bacterium]
MSNWFGRWWRGKESRLEIGGVTHPGLVRDHNEDAFATFPEQAVAVVADGMGGLSKGEIASALVIDAVTDAMRDQRTAAEGLLDAHQRLCELRAASAGERMGSTAVAITVHGQQARIDWVGDSRAYLWRDGELRQITRDHSFVAELLEAGALTAEEAETHPNRNALTRAIGVQDVATLQVDTLDLALRGGDRLLLCSDGLSGFLSHQRIADCMRSASNATAMAEELVRLTLNGTDAADNVTAVCMVLPP